MPVLIFREFEICATRLQRLDLPKNYEYSYGNTNCTTANRVIFENNVKYKRVEE